MATETEADWVEKIGKPAYESIAAMVAALDCDRLEELRDEREALADECEKYVHAKNERSKDGDVYREAAKALREWDEENGEELAELEAAAGECKDQDEARERINEDALDITIRGERVNGDWEADEFTILLSTGGPAVRIKGELGNHNEPSSATLEVQDWLKAWTPYTPIAVSEDVLLSYCRCFNFE